MKLVKPSLVHRAHRCDHLTLSNQENFKIADPCKQAICIESHMAVKIWGGLRVEYKI